jgi:hypothetical protein
MFNISATITNVGEPSTRISQTNLTVTRHSDSVQIKNENKETAILARDGTATKTWQMPMPTIAGTYDVKVCADFTNLIVESDPNTEGEFNCKTTNFTISGTPANVSVRALAPVGETTTLNPGRVIKKAIQIEISKTAGDLNDKIKSITLALDPSTTFPKDKLLDEKLQLTTFTNTFSIDKNSGLTKSSDSNQLLITFPTTYALGSSASFTLYVKPDVSEIDGGKKFRYTISNVQIESIGTVRSITPSTENIGPEFIVVDEPVNAPTGEFNPVNASIIKGESTRLNWSIFDAESISIDGVAKTAMGIGELTEGSQVVSPTTTTKYTLTASNSRTSGSITRETTITVTEPTTPGDGGGTTTGAPTITAFATTNTSVTSGDTATLTWSTANATTVTLDGVAVSPASFKAVNPTRTTTYTLTATKGSQSTNKTVTIAVNATGNFNPPVTPPTQLTCEQQGLFEFTNLVRFRGKTKGMCISCPTNTFVRNDGICPRNVAGGTGNGGTGNSATGNFGVVNNNGVANGNGSNGTGNVGNQIGTQINSGTSTETLAGTSTNIDLAGTGRLHSAPDESETGPETLIYLVPLAAMAGVRIWKKRRKIL